ncbi:MAG: 3'-5' exonuclease [Rhizobium sp.]|nr:3'-5' exonuclease [Rhizobium sp.]
MTASAASPLIALESVVIDTETTGLDVRADRIIQLGGVRMNGADIELADAFDAVVDPGVAIPAASSRVHGLTDADMAGKPNLAQIIPTFSTFIGERIVIGHSIHFDLAMLRHESIRQGYAWTQPRAFDVALIAAGLEPGLVDTSLESLAVGLGVELSGRHTAIGDALTTARVFAALQPRLLAAGVRTVGELESLCRKPSGLIAHQESAGWYDSAGKRPDFALGRAPQRRPARDRQFSLSQPAVGCHGAPADRRPAGCEPPGRGKGDGRSRYRLRVHRFRRRRARHPHGARPAARPCKRR